MLGWLCPRCLVALRVSTKAKAQRGSQASSLRAGNLGLQTSRNWFLRFCSPNLPEVLAKSGADSTKRPCVWSDSPVLAIPSFSTGPYQAGRVAHGSQAPSKTVFSSLLGGMGLRCWVESGGLSRRETLGGSGKGVPAVGPVETSRVLPAGSEPWETGALLWSRAWG